MGIVARRLRPSFPTLTFEGRDLEASCSRPHRQPHPLSSGLIGAVPEVTIPQRILSWFTVRHHLFNRFKNEVIFSIFLTIFKAQSFPKLLPLLSLLNVKIETGSLKRRFKTQIRMYSFTLFSNSGFSRCEKRQISSLKCDCINKNRKEAIIVFCSPWSYEHEIRTIKHD